MSAVEPDKPYVYQPYGSVSHPDRDEIGRLWGVGGVSLYTEIKGLTKNEAKAVRDALISLQDKPT